MAIDSRVIKTISENTAKDGTVFGMWVIQYFDPEARTNISVKVVCGKKKIKDDGSIWYVAGGLNVKDFATLKPAYAEFAKLSANPPAIAAAAADQSDEIDETPF